MLKLVMRHLKAGEAKHTIDVEPRKSTAYRSGLTTDSSSDNQFIMLEAE